MKGSCARHLGTSVRYTPSKVKPEGWFTLESAWLVFQGVTVCCNRLENRTWQWWNSNPTHLTSHSRVSDSRWVSTLLWFSRSLRPFFFYIVLLCIFANFSQIYSSSSLRPLPFMSFIVPTFAWNIPLVSPVFSKRTLVFPVLLISFISWHCSIKKAILSLLAIFCNTAFSYIYIFFLLSFHFLLFSAIFKASWLSWVFSSTTIKKHQFMGSQSSLWSNSHIHTWLLKKP